MSKANPIPTNHNRYEAPFQTSAAFAEYSYYTGLGVAICTGIAMTAMIFLKLNPTCPRTLEGAISVAGLSSAGFFIVLSCTSLGVTFYLKRKMNEESSKLNQ